jgi:hypothetical protein
VGVPDGGGTGRGNLRFTVGFIDGVVAGVHPFTLPQACCSLVFFGLPLRLKPALNRELLKVKLRKKTKSKNRK